MRGHGWGRVGVWWDGKKERKEGKKKGQREEKEKSRGRGNGQVSSPPNLSHLPLGVYDSNATGAREQHALFMMMMMMMGNLR